MAQKKELMTEKTIASRPLKRRKWLRLLAWIAGAVVVLVVAAYFIVTSSAFFKGVILPRVSQAIQAQVTVNSAAIHPFRQVVLRDLKVQPKGQAPLIMAHEVRLDYSLWDILGGNLHIANISLVSPTIELVKNPDGSSNLDPIMRALARKSAKQPAPPSSTVASRPPRFDLGKLTLSNANIIQVSNLKNGGRNLNALTNLNITIENVKNGQTGHLQLSAGIEVQNKPPAPALPGRISGTLQGKFTFQLTPKLGPGVVQGDTRLRVTSVAGTMRQFAGLGADFRCDITSTNLNQVALDFQRNGKSLGRLVAGGPLNLNTLDGRVRIELLSLDKRVLNLFGAQHGIDFGTTTINSTNEIELAKSGARITVGGRFDADTVQLKLGTGNTPTVSFHTRYGVTVNRTAENAELSQLTLDGTERGRPILQCTLAKPMTFSWGGSASATGDSSLNLNLTNLDLAEWKSFLGDTVSSGEAGLRAQLNTRQGGKELAFKLDSQIAGLNARVGSNQLSQALLTFHMSGNAADFKQLTLHEFKWQLTRQQQPLLTVSGSGTCALPMTNANFQIALDGSLPGLTQVIAAPTLRFPSGTVSLNARIGQKESTQTVTGTLTLANLTGHIGQNRFHDFGAGVNLDLNRSPQEIRIKKVAGHMTQDQKPGGRFNLSGTYNPTNQSAQLTAQLSDFNQNSLEPFLQPLLGSKRLVSVAINGQAKVQYQPSGKSAVQAEMQVTNLVVHDPQQSFPVAALAAGLRVDVSLQNQTADLHQVQVALTPTDRARNQLQLTGLVDYSKTNAICGHLKLASDSLDLTKYYDLFSSTSKPTPAAPSHPAPAPATASASASAQEPPPVTLPFRDFTAEAAIGHCYLHEIAITNLLAKTSLNGGRVEVKPFQLVLNGAPVNANVNLDLGVPGYRYDLAFNADQVPFAPLVDTFAPERKGQMGGTLNAHAQIRGEGITGASLQKHLSGTFDIGTTNLDLSVINIRSRLLKSVINVVAMIPELLHNPEGALGSLLGELTGRQTGLAGEIQQSPIDAITARGKAGAGKITLDQAVVRSPAFEAQANGSITLNQVLTNSTLQIPVTLSLSRSIASRLNLTPTNTPTTAAYVTLPSFLTMTGTLGDPKRDINRGALAGIAVQALGVNVHGSKLNPRGLLNDLGGLLKGNRSESTTSSGSQTNAPATNQSPVKNLLDRFLKR